ncbi:MAG: YdiY family protein [Planctomycetota bacterium]
MRNLISTAAIAALSAGALAQDKITLANGDTVTGAIQSMADGKVTFKSALLDEIVVPFDNIADLTTGGNVTLKAKDGDVIMRRITGIEAGALQFDGGATTSLAIDNLGMINPPEKEAPKWTGSLKFTGINTTGNTEVRSAGLFFDAVRKTDADRLSVDAQWDYAEQKTPGAPTGSGYVLSQRRTGAGLKYDYFLSDRAYLWVAARALGDTIANLDLRFTASAGVGYQVIDTEKVQFLFEAGLAYFNENYRVVLPGQIGETDFLAARLAYRYENQLSDDTKLVHRAEAFPSLEDSADFYCQVTTELSTSLTDNMIASVAHILDYDNTPAPGFERADNRVILTVGWSF